MSAIVTSDRKLLPARPALPAPPVLTPFLSQPGDTQAIGRWWVLETESDPNTGVTAGFPFELELVWSFGGDFSGKVRLTAGQGTRVCFPARSFTVRAANLAFAPSTVSVRASTVPAPFQTRNVWTQVFEMPGPGVDLFVVPPMARSVRLEVGDPAAKATAALDIIDLNGGTISFSSSYTFAEQPPEGVVLGSAQSVRASAPAGTWCRLVWSLHI